MKSPSGTICLTAAACLIASFLVGCGSTEPISSASRELPFVVKLNQVRIVGAGGSPEAAPAPGFGNAPDLTRRMAEKLRKAGAFTWVSLEEDKQISPDLELQVEFIEPDFGAGEVEWVGATFSTLTWLLAGHLSWVINNREYPNARVVMRVDLHPAVKESDAETAKRDWYHDDLPLKGLSTNFYERADARFWALNILVPPGGMTATPRPRERASSIARSITSSRTSPTGSSSRCRELTSGTATPSS